MAGGRMVLVPRTRERSLRSARRCRNARPGRASERRYRCDQHPVTATGCASNCASACFQFRLYGIEADLRLPAGKAAAVVLDSDGKPCHGRKGAARDQPGIESMSRWASCFWLTDPS